MGMERKSAVADGMEWNGVQAELIAGLLMKKTDSPNTAIFKAVNRFKNESQEEKVEEVKTDKERAMELATEARRNFFSSLASVFLGNELVAEFQVAAGTTIAKKHGVAARLKERRKMDEAKEVSHLLPPSTITVHPTVWISRLTYSTASKRPLFPALALVSVLASRASDAD